MNRPGSGSMVHSRLSSLRAVSLRSWLLSVYPIGGGSPSPISATSSCPPVVTKTSSAPRDAAVSGLKVTCVVQAPPDPSLNPGVQVGEVPGGGGVDGGSLRRKLPGKGPPRPTLMISTGSVASLVTLSVTALGGSLS